GIVVRRNEFGARVARKRQRSFLRIVIVLPLSAKFRAVTRDRGNLRLRRVDRREDDKRKAEPFAGGGERASVITGGRRDNARRRRAAFQPRDDGVERAARLERVRELLRFQL